MKKAIAVISLLSLIACKPDATSKTEASGELTETEITEAGETASEQKPEEEDAQVVPHELRDNKNQLMAYVMLPANWIMHREGKASMSGPGDVFVYNIPMKNFMFTNDQYMAQNYRANGGVLRQFTSAEEIVRQDLVPMAQRQGAKLISITNAPAIAKADQAPTTMMYTIGQRDYRYQSVISEWEDKDGKPYAIIVHLNGTGMSNAIMWNYYASIIAAPENRYESAKKIVVDALTSITYNPRYFDQYNQNEQQRESSSWAAFNQRMASNWQAFNSQQAAFRAKSEAVNQSIMGSYESRMASMDKNHNKFLNYIKGEETVRGSDGTRHQVQGGSNQYYLNGDNQYIGTNDPNYDPNRDPSVNNHQWNQGEITD